MSDPADDHRDVIPLSHVEQLRDARSIIRREADALSNLAEQLDGAFCDAVRLIHEASGSVIVTGVGKAGLIGQKIVATMASTGTRAYFLHPTEAVHGDLGCVGNQDIVLALSNSGRSDEVVRLLPILSRRNIPVIAITRDRENPLAHAAKVVLPIGCHTEAGDLKLAPTVSTTAMIAMGDALSLVLSRAQSFTENDFAMFHPAGSLGKKLQPVREIMRAGTEFRIAPDSNTVRDVMIELRRPGRRTGAVVLTGANGRISGIFTDSDLARLFEQRRDHMVDRPICEVMTANPTTIQPHALMPEAMQLMSERKISELPVVDPKGIPLGLIDITDVIDSGSLASNATTENAIQNLPERHYHSA